MQKDYDFEKESSLIYNKKLANKLAHDLFLQWDYIIDFVCDIFRTQKEPKTIKNLNKLLKDYTSLNFRLFTFRKTITKLKTARKKIVSKKNAAK